MPTLPALAHVAQRAGGLGVRAQHLSIYSFHNGAFTTFAGRPHTWCGLPDAWCARTPSAAVLTAGPNVGSAAADEPGGRRRACHVPVTLAAAHGWAGGVFSRPRF